MLRGGGRPVAIGAARAGVDDSSDAGRSGGIEQVDGACHAGGIGVQRLRDATRHGSQGGFVEDNLDTFDRSLHVAAVCEITFDEFELACTIGRYLPVGRY